MDVEVIANCSSGKDALLAIEKENPDILFLDIEMPEMNGFEMLQQLEHPKFEVIFTTAYNDYAIKAIKHSALDYLLKPIDKNELLLSVQRVKERLLEKNSRNFDNLHQFIETKKKGKRLAVSTQDGIIMVDAENVVYCESDSSYCRIFFSNSARPLIICKTLKEVEEVLGLTDFCRIHHSYLINMKFVQSYIRGEGGEVVLSNGVRLPVSRTRKQDFLSLLEMM